MDVNQTVDVLRAESRRLRALADRCDALAREISGETNQAVSPSATTLPGFGEYSRLTQKDAILKALSYGPQTTREIFNRINAGGQSVAKATYVTALLPRLKDKVERTEDGKIRLKSNGS